MRDLHRRRFHRKSAQAVPAHVQGEVHENVDPVVTDLLRELLVGKPGCVTPGIGMATKALAYLVRLRNIGITKNLELLSIMMLQNRLHEKADDMMPQVRRNVSDAKALAGSMR